MESCIFIKKCSPPSRVVQLDQSPPPTKVLSAYHKSLSPTPYDRKLKLPPEIKSNYMKEER